jgi:hypothetical protein
MTTCATCRYWSRPVAADATAFAGESVPDRPSAYQGLGTCLADLELPRDDLRRASLPKLAGVNVGTSAYITTPSTFGCVVGEEKTT